jgi:hypothetical protein
MWLWLRSESVEAVRPPRSYDPQVGGMGCLFGGIVGEGSSSEAYRVLYRKKRLGYAAGSRLLLLQKAEKLGKKV